MGRLMRRLLAAVTVAFTCAVGTASADTFVVVPTTSAPVSVALPAVASALAPNEPGSLLLPPGVFVASFGIPQAPAYSNLLGLWQAAGAAYGVPWQVLGAINKIESNFGRNMGPSSAGAVGWMQFMPDTWFRWGMDASGDGIADPWNPADAIYSAARYLAASGAATDVPASIFSYNHAQWYVDEVLQLAGAFEGGGAIVAYDGLQQRLAAAQDTVVAANEALEAARVLEADLTRQAETTAARVNATVLLSDRLDAERSAFKDGDALAAATSEVVRLEAQLAESEAALAAARDGTQAASFGAGSLLGGPVAIGAYTFPVGGGPGVVSVGRDHHDYPAADIVAPQGTPVYALADAVVLESWPEPSGRCGIGITMQTGDGLVWTYCHLAYLEAGVAAGVALAAGAPVGLVGSTGRSTGPHLHLQLQPAVAYPQQMPWFQELAGIAFVWNDASAVELAKDAVFAVVQPEDTGEPVIQFTLESS